MCGSGAVVSTCSLLIRGPILPAVRQKFHLSSCAEIRSHFCNRSPASLKGTPVTIHLIVDDADTFTERAVSAGAKVVMPVADMFWGDRYGVIEDPFGHHWSIATPKRQLSAAELQDAAKAFMTAKPR